MEKVSKALQGKVEFYSLDKGYGFIACKDRKEDLYFHISDVKETYPPSVGDVVSFKVEKSKKRNLSDGEIAANVRFVLRAPRTFLGNGPSSSLQSAKPIKHTPKKLDDFPCIRGQKIYGFEITKRFGTVIADGNFGLLKSVSYYSVSEAKEALIKKARSKGANAIVGYYWHKKRLKIRNLHGVFWHNTFWAEGEAVYFSPKIK